MRLKAMARKTCVLCKHFSWISGDHGYSEVTPAYPPSVYCLKSHWVIDLELCSENEYRQTMLTAETCKDFEETDIA
jgi:hypothetical protein